MRELRTKTCICTLICLLLLMGMSVVVAQGSESGNLGIPVVSESAAPVQELCISDTAYAAFRRPPGPGPFPTVIFMHGGHEMIELSKLKKLLRAITREQFLEWGYVVVDATRRPILPDPQERGVIPDTLAIIEAVKELDFVDPESVVLYGGSGGGSLALEVAGKIDLAGVVVGEPASIILIGMYKKEHPAKKGALQALMKMDPRLLYTDELQKRTRKKLKDIRCPILILHGDQHSIKNVNLRVLVPEMVEMGNDVRLIIFPGEDHGFYFGRGSAEATLKSHSEADAFYRKYIRTQPTPVDPEHLVESESETSP